MHETIAAIGTAFRLQIVRLLVPQKTCLRRQHFAAVADIFLFAHHHFGVSLAMLR